MSPDSELRLRTLQARLAADAQIVTTRSDYLRLRAYWGDITEILNSELDTQEDNR